MFLARWRVRRWLRDPRVAAGQITAAGAPAVSALCECLAAKQVTVRRRASEVAGQLAVDRTLAESLMRVAASDPDQATRTGAESALARMAAADTDVAVTVVKAALEGTTRGLRSCAKRLIAIIGPSQCQPFPLAPSGSPCAVDDSWASLVPACSPPGRPPRCQFVFLRSKVRLRLFQSVPCGAPLSLQLRLSSSPRRGPLTSIGLAAARHTCPPAGGRAL